MFDKSKATGRSFRVKMAILAILNMLKKHKTLIYVGVIILMVAIGFEIIDSNLANLEYAPFYYDYLNTAKWLLIGGFTLHGVINFFIDRSIQEW